MSTQYRLVYMLAEKKPNGTFEPIKEHGEFKEVSIFYDRKFVENEDY